MMISLPKNPYLASSPALLGFWLVNQVPKGVAERP